MPNDDATNPFSVDEQTEVRDSLLMKLYVETGLPLDYLAYTQEFEDLFSKFVTSNPTWTRKDVFRRILSLRKQGKLPRLARPFAPDSKLDTESDAG